MLAERLEAPVFNGGRTTFDNLLKHPSLRELALVIDMRGEEQVHHHFTPLGSDRPFQPLRNPTGSLLSSVPPERFLPAPWLVRMGNRMLRDLLGLKRRRTTEPGWLFDRGVHDPEQLDEIVEAAVARAEAVRALEIEYAFVAVPKKQTIYGPEQGLQLDDYTLQFTETLAKALRARGIPSVDLAPAMRLAKGELVYFRTDTHWTAHGVRVAADELIGQLDLAGVLEAKGVNGPDGGTHLGDQ